ncbi:MAG TPA: hypothetical protein VEY06_01305 [Flavisolibacter sp.]|nr:hypothetical protein [Flavisolibacter sp.]
MLAHSSSTCVVRKENDKSFWKRATNKFSQCSQALEHASTCTLDTFILTLISFKTLGG